MSGKNCPGCSQDIGIMAIIKAGFPGKVICPHCNTAVIYKPFPWLFTSFLAITFLFTLIIIIPITYTHLEHLGGLAPVIRIIIIALIWLPFEIALGKYLRAKCNLELKYNK